ncbi:MAG: hypothetical protein CMP20_15330 [Rickettsiales bacterium]|nr:hypothetical protein [Rickettsiales bacterium]
MSDEWVEIGLPGQIEELESDDDQTLHEHVFGDAPNDQNDSILDDAMGEIPDNVDTTLRDMLNRRKNSRTRASRRDTRSETPGRRNRSRSRERTLCFQRNSGARVVIDCTLCERTDQARLRFEQYVIEQSGKRSRSLAAICRIAWNTLVNEDDKAPPSDHYIRPRLEDAAHHVLRHMTHPNILVQEQIDTLRGQTQELTATAKIGTAPSGATIYDPNYITRYKIVAEQLLKWCSKKPGDMEGFLAPTNNSDKKQTLTGEVQPYY